MKSNKSDRIVEAAIQLAVERGYLNVSRDEITTRAGVSCGLVNYYFATVEGLWYVVMDEAIKREIPSIIADGLSAGNLVALGAPEALKNKAVRYLTSR
jgi:AcrR family transcriptional regulator